MNACTILFLSFESSVTSYSALAPFSEMQNFRNIKLNAIMVLRCVQHEVIHDMHLAMLSNNARVGFTRSLKNCAALLADRARSRMSLGYVNFVRSHWDARLSSPNGDESILSLKRVRETAD